MSLLKKFRILIASFAVAGLLAACTSSRPVCATSNPVGSKTGEVSSWMFGMWDFGGENATIYNAAREGGITKISTVDYQFTNYIIVYKGTVLVNGD